MSSEKIIQHCAPTLAGIKTANLFNEFFDNEDELLAEIERFNKTFNCCGLRMVLIALQNKRALIYVYRVQDLKNDFNNCLSKELLAKYGYDSTDILTSIERLSIRIEDQKEFPHEIGLFLGYPPEDVKGFIDNGGKNYKSLGYWKVYGDEKKANQTFEKYRECQRILLDRLKKGYSLKQLVIQK